MRAPWAGRRLLTTAVLTAFVVLQVRPLAFPDGTPGGAREIGPPPAAASTLALPSERADRALGTSLRVPRPYAALTLPRPDTHHFPLGPERARCALATPHARSSVARSVGHRTGSTDDPAHP